MNTLLMSYEQDNVDRVCQTYKAFPIDSVSLQEMFRTVKVLCLKMYLKCQEGDTFSETIFSSCFFKSKTW